MRDLTCSSSLRSSADYNFDVLLMLFKNDTVSANTARTLIDNCYVSVPDFLF